MFRRRFISILTLLPLTAQAQAPAAEQVGTTILEIAGWSVSLVDLLPFCIAAGGILGLLLIRRQTRFL